MDIWGYTILGIIIVYMLMIIATVYTVLHERRDPVRAVTWIAVLVLVPVGGLVVFIFFGQNYRKQKIFNRKELNELSLIEAFSKSQIREIDDMKDEDISYNRHIIKLLLNNSKSILTLDNDVEILNNGHETFDSIKQALHAATETIHLEYYIIEDDNIGNEIADILCEKAHQGVVVRVIYDDVGSWSLSREYISRLRKAGVQIHCFMPVVFPWFTSKINYRNHRKIIVIDSKIGFTGGLNIADRYIVGTKRGKWRDTHLKIEGGAVAMLQIAFVSDWWFATKELLMKEAEKYMSKTEVKTGGIAMQIAVSGPDSDYATIMQAYFSAITNAKNHIYISTPYFLPNETILTALKVAALSGIDVRIMLPSRSDSKMVHWASRSYFAELMEAKIKVYLYNDGFNHGKIITIDSVFSSVGTANMDVRSFEDNFEVTAMIYDRKTTERIEQSLAEDLKHCTKLNLHRWHARKHQDNFKESVARLFSPLL